MKTYIYSGPPSGVTLANGAERLLFPGKRVELPEDSAYTKRLLEKQLLREAPRADVKLTAARASRRAPVSVDEQPSTGTAVAADRKAGE